MSKIIIEKTGGTILEEIMRKKINHGHSCLNGMCGACKCKKPIKGDFSYIVEPIAIFDEKEEFLPCVSIVDGDSVELEVVDGRIKK